MSRGALVLALAALCAGPARAELQVEAWTPPARAPAAQPSVSVREGEAVYASWIERDGKGHRLRFSRWDAGGFAAPRTVARGERWFANWADFPALMPLRDGALAAFWLERNGSTPYAYGVRVARSHDDGRTWSRSISPHDASPTEHGFVALWPWSDGSLALAWLDGRATGAGGHGEHGGAMSLRAAVLDDALATRQEWQLDTRTCDCCQTDAAVTRSGPVLVYRDRSEDEIRDIKLVRWDGERWSAPVVVHADGWKMPACPVNGPALAARGEDVYVGWYTGAGDVPRVRLAHSRDGGRSFAAPLDLAVGDALGRVDLAVGADGAVWVSWLTEDASNQRIWLARFDATLVRSERTLLDELERGRSTGFPRMAAFGDALHVIWTASADGKPTIAGARVRVRAADPER